MSRYGLYDWYTSNLNKSYSSDIKIYNFKGILIKKIKTDWNINSICITNDNKYIISSNDYY